jgi:hypothetical protein
MTWSDFYLICFAVGVGFSILAYMGGMHFHIHIGHWHFGQVHHGHHGPSRLNAMTIAAFLAWFGGAGFLLQRYSGLWSFFALVIAAGIGMIGAGVLAIYIGKYLVHEGEALDPADYEMVGMLGHVSSTVRPEGTGEMIYSAAGTRRHVAVRSETGKAIARDVEVVVTRYEHGIAWVRPLDEIAGDGTEDSH